MRTFKYPHAENFSVDHAEYGYDKFFKIIEATGLKYTFKGKQHTAPFPVLTFERGDAVALLVFNTDTQTIELQESFRLPAYKDGGNIIETSAGMIKENEKPAIAACREVYEELGYALVKNPEADSSEWIWDTSRVHHLYTFYVSPGGTSERILLYYAEVDNKDKGGTGGGRVEESEVIAPVSLTIRGAERALINNIIKDAKTIIALQWFIYVYWG